MKRIITLTAAMALLAGAGLANAADIGPYKDAGTASAFNFLPHGFYASVGFGEGFADTSVTTLTLASKGLTGDLRFGYDAKLGSSKFIVGPLVGVGLGDITGSVLSGHETWNWTIGGRAGYVFNSSDLVYGLAAYKQQRIGIQGTGLNDYAQGFEYGFGVEFDLTNNLTIGTELTRTDFGTYSPKAGVSVTASDWDGRIRLGSRF